MELIDAATAPPQDDVAPAPAAQQDYRLVFTGSGSEYFRIWIVNLALTLATLGIYSAWAKVRRMQYFYRNTLLEDCPFNFHADPRVILRGRMLAVVLALAYHYAFGFSLEFGVAVIAVLLLGLPYLMMSALRFRLRNSSYRGLRFGFAGSIGGAYASYAPVVVIFLLPGALASVPEAEAWFAASTLLYFGWPFAYAWMKRYQHSNLRYAQCQSTYTAETSEFFITYFKMSGLVLLGVVGVFIVSFIAAFLAQQLEALDPRWARMAPAIGMLVGFYLMFLLTAPYVSARIANLVWNHTRLDDVSFESRISAARLIRLQARNAVLTLLTLGLYRPFAVVSVHKYRISCMTVRSAVPLETLLAGAHATAPGAAGDGAADLLDFDLSW